MVQNSSSNYQIPNSNKKTLIDINSIERFLLFLEAIYGILDISSQLGFLILEI